MYLMRPQAEIEEDLKTTLVFEQSYAEKYHEAKMRLAVHKRPWYEHAERAAYRSFCETKARRRQLEWVLNLAKPEESKAYYLKIDEPPYPPGWQTEPNERFKEWAARESYVPWRELVFQYNHSPEQAGQPPLTRKAFYERCVQDMAFKLRWTPYADLENTPHGPIDGLDLNENAGPPID